MGLPLRRRVENLVHMPRDLIKALASPEVREDLLGGRHALAYFRHLARGNRIRRKRFFDNVDANHPPVLMLHGYFGTRGSMFLLERWLTDEGLCTFSFNLGMLNTRDIRASAFLVHRKVEAILEQAPHVKRIDIVGHSMGGLIGLYYVKKLGGADKVRKLIMVGTPHRGTWAALGGIMALGLLSESSWQLLPHSSFLTELERGPLPEGVEYFSIAAERDWICPLSATYLRGAHLLTVPFGHAGLVVSDVTYGKIVWALKRGVVPLDYAPDNYPTPWAPER
ncbi:MAG TPA: alpha/beta fold hydrolase [Polyangia bacterium]|jgi:triacylglycerol esterase/lipase EstA (alpha/beta hydrolase family)